MKHRMIRLVSALLLALALMGQTVLAKVVEPGEDFVYLDEAGVLSDALLGEIYFSNQRLEEACGAQLVVVTLNTTGSTAIDDYANELFNTWGIGDSQKKNGFLLLLAVDDGRYYAVAGAGLQANLTAGVLKRYYSIYLEEDFAAKRYEAGVKKFYEAVFKDIADIHNVSVTAAQGVADYEAFVAEENAAYEQQQAQNARAQQQSSSTAITAPTRGSSGQSSGGSGMGMILVAIIAVVVLLLVLRSRRSRVEPPKADPVRTSAIPPTFGGQGTVRNVPPQNTLNNRPPQDSSLGDAAKLFAASELLRQSQRTATRQTTPPPRVDTRATNSMRSTGSLNGRQNSGKLFGNQGGSGNASGLFGNPSGTQSSGRLNNNPSSGGLFGGSQSSGSTQGNSGSLGRSSGGPFGGSQSSKSGASGSSSSGTRIYRAPASSSTSRTFTSPNSSTRSFSSSANRSTSSSSASGSGTRLSGRTGGFGGGKGGGGTTRGGGAGRGRH